MRSVTVRGLFHLLAGVFLVLMALLALATYQQIRIGSQVAHATEQRYKSYLLADELRQSSDELTRLARTYVVTADPKWEQQYFEVLAIRNGKAPRPEHYDRIYWDFRAADINPSMGASTQVPLRQRMENAGFSTEEFALLAQAEANSNALVQTETVAMNLVKGLYEDGRGSFTRAGPVDLEKARMMMHDLKYHQEKARIMQPVNQFLKRLDERTLQEVELAQQQAVSWLTFLLTLIAIITSVFIIGLAASFRLLRRALGGEPLSVVDTLKRIASGDLAYDIDRPISDSVIDHAESMRKQLVRMMREIRENAEAVNSLAAQLLGNSHDSAQRADLQQSHAEQVASAMTEMAATVQEVAHQLVDVATITDEVDQQTRKGTQVIGANAAILEALTAEFDQLSQVISSLEQKSQDIYQVVDVINAIAEQTNLLALNAAIEAARAGEQGRGFAVVADEVRSLASRTQNSVSEIHNLIEELQQSSQKTTAMMDTNTRQVHQAQRNANEARDTFSYIAGNISLLRDRNLQVATAAEEQGTVASDIEQSLEEIRNSVIDSAAGAKSLKTAADQLNHSSEQMIAMIKRFRLP